MTLKALLGIFLLGAQLCPCAAAAAEWQESAPAAAHHDPQLMDAMEDCHGESSRDDCGMAEMADIDGIAAKSGPSADDGGAMLVDATVPIAFLTDPGVTMVAQPVRSRLPLCTPVALSDRLLD